MDLTVAICTFRRREPLRAALESLAGCAPIRENWELLIVDNAGPGGEPLVAEMVKSFGGRLPVRYAVEATLGTSHARNCAVRAATAPIVLFTDDDVTFDRQWLVNMASAIRGHPECDFWGGRVEPVWPAGMNGPPAWFDLRRCPMLGDSIVRYQQGDILRYWGPAHDPPFYTANLALRVEAVARVGYFDVNVGHRGGRRMGMEDSLMVRAIATSGGGVRGEVRGWYAADAVVHHPVPPERLTRRYARGFAWRQGWLSVHLQRQDHAGRTPRWLYRAALGQIGSGVAEALAGVVFLDPGRRFVGTFQVVNGLSKLWHACGSH